MTAAVLHPLSSGADGSGRLYLHEAHVLRGVNAHAVEDMLRFIGSPVTAELVLEGLLLPGEIVEDTELPYPLVIRHPLLPRVTFATEWTAAMLKEAALTCLEVSQRILKAGFFLADAHVRNIIFYNSRAMVIDYGSFVPIIDSNFNTHRSYRADLGFTNNFIVPLELMVDGYSALVRSFFLRNIKFTHKNLPRRRTFGQWVRDTGRWLAPKLPEILYPVARRTGDHIWSKVLPADERTILRTVKTLRRRIEAIRLPPPLSRWTHYQSLDARVDPTEASARKVRAVHDLLAGISFSSVTDLGCNLGLHTMEFAKAGIPTVAIDSDDACVTEVFKNARRLSLPITPALMSIVSPTLTSPFSEGAKVSASARLSGELVLCLAVMHHLLLKQKKDFHSFFESLRVFSRRYVLVEFVPADDETIKQWYDEVPEWYTKQNFITASQRFFSVVRSSASGWRDRSLYLLELTENV